MKRLRKTVVRTPSSEVVKGFFDTAFSVTEDKVNSILSNLKVKNKWDYKEKSKKQEVIIKELRESVAVLLAEVRSLRDNCLAHEGEVTMLLRESLDEFQETTLTISGLRVAEDKLRKELARYKAELSDTASSVQQIRKDHSPLKRKLQDYEAAMKDLQLALLNEQALRQAACAERSSLEIELEVLKNKSEDNLRFMRDQCDRRQEQAVQGYRDEVASLRTELSKRQSDVDRVSFEKSDSDRQKSLLHAELMLSQSKAREAEAARDRAEKDVQRIAEDLAQLKEQLLHRDADLRSTLNSLAEIQRQASEEKAELRAEIK
jgi:chromosome segregation ATPase